MDQSCINHPVTNIPNRDIKIGQGQDLNDCELIQEENLRNFSIMDNIELPHPPENSDSQDT